MKKDLYRDYVVLCNVIIVLLLFEFLFGDLFKLIKDILDVNKLMKKVRLVLYSSLCGWKFIFINYYFVN